VSTRNSSLRRTMIGATAVVAIVAAAVIFVDRGDGDAAMASATRNVMKRLNPRFRNLTTQVRSLSGGQRQSVAIARAVHFNAKILIMDDPPPLSGRPRRLRFASSSLS
jgi:ABC-type lipoprotein export system ATPase subunit